MQGTSRAALAASREALREALAGADGGGLGEELLALSGVVHGNAVLLRALGDPSREPQGRADLVERLFGGKVSSAAVAVTQVLARQRWGTQRDLGASLEALGVEALLSGAHSQGRLDQVEDELFRFGRIVGGSDELRAAVTDPAAPASSKDELVRELLEQRAAPETLRLARQAVATHRRRRFDSSIEEYLAIAARRQEQLTATVVSATPLDAPQVERLTRALAEEYGRAVRVNEVVDPAVLGGLRVEIGDEVIDGTIRSRLDEARRRLAG